MLKLTAWTVAIILVSASLGVLVDWRAPGIERYTRDWLMRARGPLPAPDDIAIVAIDDASIARFGRFPWPRSVMAKAIDALSAAQPKVIALDVLFTDPTIPEDDDELAVDQESWERSRCRPVDRAVHLAASAAQYRRGGGLSRTCECSNRVRRRGARDPGAQRRRCRPIVSGDATGGHSIADGTPERAVLDGRGEILLGRRVIPVEVLATPVAVGQTKGTVEVLRAGRMNIDYVGPSGSFSAKTYSIADVLDGKTPPSRFAGPLCLDRRDRRLAW